MASPVLLLGVVGLPDLPDLALPVQLDLGVLVTLLALPAAAAALFPAGLAAAWEDAAEAVDVEEAEDDQADQQDEEDAEEGDLQGVQEGPGTIKNIFANLTVKDE